MSVLQELVEAGRRLDARGWVPATSGNLSARDSAGVWITASGRHKGRLIPEDFLRLGPAGEPPPGRIPSAETALHLAVYSLVSDAACVLHTHSVHATVLSRLHPEGVRFEGHEIAKAFPGIGTHEGEHRIPVFPNAQDMAGLAARVAAAPLPLPGFLLSGHGLYAFGSSVEAAMRHLEAFEHLFACLTLERTLSLAPPAGSWSP
jgi:methylthioribulose-1-phosphate dehydratase